MNRSEDMHGFGELQGLINSMFGITPPTPDATDLYGIVSSRGDTSPFAILENVYETQNKDEYIVAPEIIRENYPEPIPVKIILQGALDAVSGNKLVLPNTLKRFNECNFCKIKFKVVNIPSSITVIPKGLFANSTVEEIIFDAPQNIQKIEEGAFSHMPCLKKITWPENCTTIPSECFAHSHLEEITGLSKVIEVGDSAFSDTPNLKNITWPSSCPKIPAGCFIDSGIESINGIEHIKSIGAGAFMKTPNLDTFKWPDKCPIVPMDCFDSSGVRTFIGNDLIKNIRQGAFFNSKLNSITGLDSVKKIGTRAFGMLRNLKSFKWPDKCKTIPPACFAFSSIETIENLNQVHRIEEFAFSASGIKDEIYLGNIEYIGAHAFEPCSISKAIISNSERTLAIHSTSFSCAVDAIGIDNIFIISPLEIENFKLNTEFDTNVQIIEESHKSLFRLEN